MDNMKFIKITNDNFDELKILQTKYKSEIGEEEPTYENFLNLERAISDENIYFFGCICNGKLVACCSISTIFSTFNYEKGGIFVDFFIIKELVLLSLYANFINCLAIPLCLYSLIMKKSSKIPPFS